MKEKLLTLIETTNSKKISQMVKKDTELFKWIQLSHGITVSEKIYNSINADESLCEYGNNKKFKSLTQGYGFCGKASACRCAKESVSKKVSETKSNYSDTTKHSIQQKRQSTNISKYGIENVGQLDKSRLAHIQIYADQEKVKLINEQIRSTKQHRYSNPNFNNSEKIKETFKEKRNNGFWIDRYPEKNIEVLEDKNKLYELYNNNTPIEIADTLNVHVQTVYKYLNLHQLREPFKSADEQELVRFIESLGITNIVTNTRKLLPSRKEIDIYLPDLDIAIEYNGVYWHHEDVNHITRDYHYNKFVECEQLGIQLITVFSNFWHNKKEIVKNTIKMKLKCFDQPSIYARKCSVKLINNKIAKEFLNKYHIQGYTPATVCLGLFYNESIVALMTFSKNRTGIGKINNNTELVRFASSGSIVGAAGKLLAYYKKQYPNEIIVSYSDNEWSNGNLYKALGFQLASEVKYSYWYLKPREHRLYHRFSFSKQKLVKQGHDSTKSESQITRELGLLKVWDCGKRKWILN